MSRTSNDRRGSCRGVTCFPLASRWVAILLLALVGDAHAVDISWRRPEGGTFSSAGSWFGGVVPGVGDVAHFRLSTPGPLGGVPPYTVSFSVGATNQRLVVEDDFVTFDLNGLFYSTPTSGNEIGTEAGQTAQLTLLDGRWDDNGGGILSIGAVGNAGGNLTVSTNGRYLGKRINVGNFGPAALMVQNGGRVDSTFIPVGLSASGEVTVTGVNSNIDTAALNIGALSSGTLSIAASGSVHNSGVCVVGDGLNVPGVVNVDGANSLWANTGQVDLGRDGNATVNITGGAHADLGNTSIGSVNFGHAGTGSVTISGANSQLITGGLHIGIVGAGELHIAAGALARNLGAELEIGAASEGELEILSGGRLEAVRCILGNLTSGGTAVVSGAGSQWINSGELNVGRFSPGVLNITDQGVVQNTFGVVGSGFPLSGVAGVVTVDGINSLWINQNDLSVGDRSHGTLTITNRGKVTSVNGSVGRSANSINGVVMRGVGAVTVDGPGSEWANSGELTVGDVGMGTLNITASGLVRSANAIVGKSTGGMGEVTIDGANSLWFNTADIHVGTAGQGLISLANGGTVHAQNLAVDEFGTLQGSGTIIGNLQNNGLVTPGASIGTLQVNGAYFQQAGGVLEIEIGGLSGSHVDLLNVGAATLGGELRLELVPGTVPAVNVALTATSIAGSFANVISGQRLSTIDGLGSFVVNYGAGSAFAPTQIVLSNFLASAGIPGDYNRDGTVNAADYTVWRNTRGSTTNLTADGSGNGTVDAADYNFWRARFGNTAGSGTGELNAIPEPTTLVLLTLGLVITARNVQREIRKCSC